MSLEPGDRALTLNAFVADHGRAVETLLARLERDPSVREELWSDVMTLAYERIDDLAQLAPPQVRAWMLRTTRFLTANAARRAVTRRRLAERLAREPDHGLAPGADEAVIELVGDNPDRTALIQAAFAGLRDDHREILVMDALGQRGPEIAARLAISHQAARSRLMRARQAFASAFKGTTSEDPGPT